MCKPHRKPWPKSKTSDISNRVPVHCITPFRSDALVSPPNLYPPRTPVKFVTVRWARWNNRDEDFKDPKLKKGLHEKTRSGASFIPGWLFDFVSHFTAFTLLTGSFYISRLYEDVLHVNKIHVRFKSQTLPVPVYRQTNFTPKREVFSC